MMIIMGLLDDCQISVRSLSNAYEMIKNKLIIGSNFLNRMILQPFLVDHDN
jgi:hypothetical protein